MKRKADTGFITGCSDLCYKESQTTRALRTETRLTCGSVTPALPFSRVWVESNWANGSLWVNRPVPAEAWPDCEDNNMRSAQPCWMKQHPLHLCGVPFTFCPVLSFRPQMRRMKRCSDPWFCSDCSTHVFSSSFMKVIINRLQKYFQLKFDLKKFHFKLFSSFQLFFFCRVIPSDYNHFWFSAHATYVVANLCFLQGFANLKANNS